ncbi:MAG TPA: thioredoxin family protein [Burkholderiaceae bacterium]|jgi:peroxiredoxin|nr:thioredoxin family protein [Burkholderiaceae bacterium]
MRRTLFLGLIAWFAALPATASATALPGRPAPAFELAAADGKPVRLADLRGRFVVLEWTNPSCPFVQKHYGSGNMQALQKRYTAANVVWLTINSTAQSHPEYLPPAQMASWVKQQGGAPTAVLLDADGKVGRAYGARTTPHMYVIDPNGVLVYAGAIDDKRSANVADVKTANNYVAAALADAMAGKPVGIGHTQAYGCSIKYAD